MRIDTYLNAMSHAYGICLIALKLGSIAGVKGEDVDNMKTVKRKKRQYNKFRERIIRDFIVLSAEIDSESRWAYYYHRLLEEADIEN